MNTSKSVDVIKEPAALPPAGTDSRESVGKPCVTRDLLCKNIGNDHKDHRLLPAHLKTSLPKIDTTPVNLTSDSDRLREWFNLCLDLHAGQVETCTDAIGRAITALHDAKTLEWSEVDHWTSSFLAQAAGHLDVSNKRFEAICGRISATCGFVSNKQECLEQEYTQLGEEVGRLSDMLRTNIGKTEDDIRYLDEHHFDASRQTARQLRKVEKRLESAEINQQQTHKALGQLSERVAEKESYREDMDRRVLFFLQQLSLVVGARVNQVRESFHQWQEMAEIRISSLEKERNRP